MRSCLFLPVCLLAVSGVQAQQSTRPPAPSLQNASLRRFELGSQYAYLGKGVCYRGNCSIPPEIAFGLGLTLNLTPHIAIDALDSILIHTQQPPAFFNDGSAAGGRGSSIMAGPRFEVRRPRYGLFLYTQAGAEVWSRAPNPFVLGPGSTLITPQPAPGTRAFFAIAAGFGAEFIPTPRLHLRVSTGERVVDYGRVAATSFCPTCAIPPTAWNSGEDFIAGLYLASGKQLTLRERYREPRVPHRFFDKANNLLILSATLSSVADAVTTQLFLDKGIPEGNPVERPFVQSGVGGDIALGAIAETAGIGAMYLLHRMGHHWMERAAPAAITVLGARNAYLNSKID